MPKCSNDKTKSYKGDEPSPLGLGFASSPLEIGTVMKGNDGSDWIVGETTLGIKRWKKVFGKKEKASEDDDSSDEGKPKTKKSSKKEKSTSEEETPKPKDEPKKKKASKKDESDEEDTSSKEPKKKKTSKKDESPKDESKKKKSSKKEESKEDTSPEKDEPKKKKTSKKEESTKEDTSPKKEESKKKRTTSKKVESEDETVKEEIDFDSLPPEFFRPVYYPIYHDIDDVDETGLEKNKFGGKVPFFVKGEKWPSVDDTQLLFICQFIDPSKEDNILYRVFLPDDQNTDLDATTCCSISKIELSEENIKNQLIIPCEVSPFPAYFVEWMEDAELRDLEFILKKLKLTDDNETNRLYCEAKYSPRPDVKIGGTPFFTQRMDKIDSLDNFLQLSERTEVPYNWGDAGIAHIYRNGTLNWDCY
jgi:hypothetical protein